MDNERSEPQPAPADAAAKKKFRPRRKPVNPDEPTRQPRPQPPPAKPTEAQVMALKPKGRQDAKPTLPKNDPLDLSEHMLLGMSGLAVRAGRLKYRVDASGYIDLVRATYNEYVSRDKYFQRFVSQSMFEFYAMIAYWMRLYQIQSGNGMDNERVYQQLVDAYGTTLHLPPPLANWLAGLGNFTDPSGREYQLDIFEPTNAPSCAGLRGGFGVVGVDTLAHYACSISPAVVTIWIIPTFTEIMRH